MWPCNVRRAHVRCRAVAVGLMDAFDSNVTVLLVNNTFWNVTAMPVLNNEYVVCCTRRRVFHEKYCDTLVVLSSLHSVVLVARGVKLSNIAIFIKDCTFDQPYLQYVIMKIEPVDVGADPSSRL